MADSNEGPLSGLSSLLLAPAGGIFLALLVTPRSQAQCDCKRGVEACGPFQPDCTNVLGFDFWGVGIIHPALFGTVAAFALAGLILLIQQVLWPKS